MRLALFASGLLLCQACSSGAELPGAGGGGASTTTSTTTMTTTTSASSTTSGAGGATATSSASSAGGCGEPTAGGPAAAPYPFTLGGQTAWSHDDGFEAGYFHTYDGLQVGGPGDVPRKVHVFLPRGYDACDAGYPVVYMNDGDTAFWSGGLGNKSWHVADALAQLYAEGAIPRVIVVAVVPLHREIEYTHADWAPGKECCGVEQYTAYVADHVKPFIDAGYRTLPEAASTAIIGSSHGGLAAFYMANRRPEVFGRAGCLSPSFWAGLDPVHGGSYSGGPLATSLLLDLTKSTLGKKSGRPRLWIDWGLVRTGGLHNSAIEAAATTRGKEMVALLQGTYAYAAGSELAWEEDPLGEHDEDSWGRRFPHVMKALFAPAP